MVKAKRKCTVKGHENETILRVCIHPKCNQFKRRVCMQCQIENLHKHGEQSNDHIVKNKQLQEHLMQYQTHIGNLKDIFNKILQLQQQLQPLLVSIPIIYDILKKINNDVGAIDAIDDKQLNEVLSINYQKWQQRMRYTLKECAQSLRTYTLQIEQLSSKFINQDMKVQEQDLEQNFVQQQIEKLNQYAEYHQIKPNFMINTSQISSDERYLAVGGASNRTIIYDMQSNTEVTQLQLQSSTKVCKFSRDSNFLYIGTQDGQIVCFNISQMFKEIYRKRINKLAVHNLIEMQNQVLLLSSQNDIFRVDIKSDQIKKVEDFHQSRIFALDYHSSLNLIASGSDDRCIKISNAETLQQLWESKQSHDCEIVQIQFLPQDQLLSLAFGNVLKLWQIDHENKKLIEKKKIIQPYEIVNFRFVKETQILLICEKILKLINFNEQPIIQQEYPNQQKARFQMMQQLESLNYVMIPQEKSTIVLKKISY